MSKRENGSGLSSFFADLKSLLKGLVLVLNVAPVFTGFWLALYFTNASFSDHWLLFILTMTGSTFVVAGALVINNWYEVDLDKAMLRTKNRPTVTGRFSLKAVLIMGISFTIIGFAIMLFTTLEAIIYSFIGWFTYVVLYTFWSKRKYTLNTIIGSVSGAVTPLIGWAAIAPSNHIVPIGYFLILFIWQVPHTFAIAMRRVEEYRAAGVPMLPVVAGFEATKRQIFIYVACLLPLNFLLHELGMIFVIIMTALTIGWLVLASTGLSAKDNVRWAHLNFRYSLFYLMVMLILMVVMTI